MNIYAFDVDHTLEVSGGPVQLSDILRLKQEGHAVGICGNFAVACQRFPQWHLLFSFLGSMGMTKATFLEQIRRHIPAGDYVFVGNDNTVHPGTDDEASARDAGWRFIRERDFAEGAR